MASKKRIKNTSFCYFSSKKFVILNYFRYFCIGKMEPVPKVSHLFYVLMKLILLLTPYVSISYA